MYIRGNVQYVYLTLINSVQMQCDQDYLTLSLLVQPDDSCGPVLARCADVHIRGLPCEYSAVKGLLQERTSDVRDPASWPLAEPQELADLRNLSVEIPALAVTRTKDTPGVLIMC